MTASKTSMAVASTGIQFEELRASYWQRHQQPTKADAARRERRKWQDKFDTAWQVQGGEVSK